MKRLIVSLTVLLLGFSASAGVITRTQAEGVAKNVLGSASVDFVWNGLGDKRFGDVHPAFYVFNGADSWAIISADDCATPVLMHGEGSFDPEDMPDNMRSLLKGVEYDIYTARNENLKQTPEIRQAWIDYSVMTKAGSSPVEHLLTTASWNQRVPYNTYCPEDGADTCVTGCVATAMAILMRYYQWPQTGKGTIPEYYTDTKNIYVATKVIDGFRYDWTNMPLVYTNTSSDVQKDAVAKLMEHCGAMVKMDYTANSSGAYSSDVIPAMVKHMSYSSSAKELYRRNYSNSEWFNMIKAEIDASHPVLYGGRDLYSDGGHQFVCDGYNSNNEVHINWGWGGSRNSWYAVCYLGRPDSSYPGYTGYVFSYHDSAMFGLVPDYTGSEPARPNVEITSGQGIFLESGTIASGEFSLKLSDFWCGTDYSGKLKAALFDKGGTFKEFISDEQSVSMSSWSSNDDCVFDCSITGDIHIGDYVTVMYSYSTDKWEPVHQYNKAVPARLAALDITAIDIPSSVAAGYTFYLVPLKGQKDTQSVTWYFDGTKTTAEYITMTTGEHNFKLVITYKDGSTETIVKKVIVN